MEGFSEETVSGRVLVVLAAAAADYVLYVRDFVSV